MAESEISFWLNGGYHSKEWVWAWIFENFLEIYSLVLIFNSQRGEVLLDKKQVFHYKFIYILWVAKYLKSKRIQRSKIMNAHKPYCILPVILLSFQRIWNWSINILFIFLCFWENFSLTLQDILSDPVFLFQNFMSTLWNSFSP